MKLILTGFEKDIGARAPEVMTRHIQGQLLRAGQEVAREMKRTIAANGSMLFSTLVNSVRMVQDRPMSVLVAPGVRYGRLVDEGTGPAARKPAYMPNPTHLRAYIKARAGIRWKGKPGDATRKKQFDEVRDRAWALAIHIKAHGTKPHPFIQPTADKMNSRVHELLRGGVRSGIQDILNGAG